MNPIQSTFKALAAFCLLCTVAHATVTINATLVDQQGHAVPFAYLEVKLVDCGYNIPSVVSAPASIVIKDQKFTPSQLPATIYGNNEIACGNSYSTLYHVTAWRDSSTKLSGDNDYDICSNATNCLVAAAPSWNLAQSQPFTGSAPPPGFASIYGNPLLSQTWNQPAGTSATLNGTFIFNGNTLFNQLSPGNCVQAGANGVLTTVGFPCGQGGQGGGGAWNNNGTPTGNLALNTTTFLSTFTSGDFGNSPVNGIFSYVSGSTSVGDTSTLMRLSVPANSYQNPFYVDVNGFAQLQVANLAGSSHIGAVVMGSAIAASSLSSAFQSKAYILSAGATANPLTLMHTSASQSSALFRMHSASSSATNFDFAYACTGASAVDGSCPSANYQWRLHADGSSFQNGAVNAGPTPATACGNPLAGGATNCLAMRTSSGAVVPGVGQNTLRFTAGGPQCSINGAGETSCLGGGTGISGTPLVTQTVTQPVSTSLNVNISNNVRYVVPSFNWSFPALAVNWATPGAQTATLTPCPLGIDVTNNANQPYKVYIPTTNPEVVTVTGGTCTSGGTTGTITFTTALVHSASSNQIQSSTAGLQEAINDGCGTATGSAVTNPNCVIKGLPTGATANAPIIRAPIFVHASNMTLDLSGVLLNCATRSQCIFLGDNNNSNHYSNVKILGGSFESSVNADGCLVTATQRISNVVTITVGTCSTILTGDTVNINFTDSPAYWGNKGPVTVSGSSITYAQTGADIPSAATPGTIAPLVGITEDNAFPGIIDGADIHTGTGGGLFNQGFVVDNDQAATIRNTNYQPAGGLRCTAKHCASAVYSAGSTAATPVIWVDNANWSFQCAGNGLTNLANNTTRITNSVIQGFAQWGVNTSAILGSFGGTVLDNIYNEEGLGPCTQPYNFAVQPGSFASVGVLYSSGPPLEIRGGEQVNGNLPRLFVATGAQQLNYYVVPHDSVDGYGYPLLAGYGFTNGTGTPVIQWARIPASSAAATMTYDLIRWGGMGTVAANTPNFPTGAACTGGSPTACGSIVVNQAQCAGLVCTFTDDVASNTTSYAINSATFMPLLPFWPGGIVLHNTNPTSAALTPTVQIDSDAGSANFSPWISVAGNLRPTFFVRQCLVSGAGGGSGFAGGAWVQCLAGDNHGNSFKAVGATLYQNGPTSGGNATNVKGILNFPLSPAGSYAGAQHIITFADSNPAKTIATYYSRPPNDALDTYAGFDLTGSVAPNAVPLAFGSPVSISNYIGNIGDGTSWLERLTAIGKTFTVPVTAGVINNETYVLPAVGDQCAPWATQLAATFNGVLAYTVDARPEIATDITCAVNPLTGTPAGQLLLPPGTIHAQAGWQLPSNANGMRVIGEAASDVTKIKACAAGQSGCSADMTVNPAGQVTGVIGMGPTTPANGNDVVGSEFQWLTVDTNGVPGVMGVTAMAGQEMTEWTHINIKNAELVGADLGEGTNSIQNGTNFHDFYFLMVSGNPVYSPCPLAVDRTISTISNTSGNVVTVTLSGIPVPALEPFREFIITGQSNGGTHGVVYNGEWEIATVLSTSSFTFKFKGVAGQADSAAGNGTFHDGALGIRDFTNVNGGGRDIRNGTMVAFGCLNSPFSRPLTAISLSGGLQGVDNVHIEDVLYGIRIGDLGNTKGINIHHAMPVTNVDNGVIISNQWATSNIVIDDLITSGGGGTPDINSIVDQINGNTLTPTNNGVIDHYWVDSADGVFTDANPVGGTEVSNGVDIYNDIISIYNAGVLAFSASNSGAVTSSGSYTAGGAITAGGLLSGTNTFRVTSNYTGAGDTSAHIITGLTSPTIAANATVTIHCAGQYSITTGTAQLSLAVLASQTPVNISSQATIATNTATASYPNSVSNGGALTGATVGAFGNHFGFVVDATIFWHASLAGTVSLQAATSNASDVPVIYQGAYCSILP